MERDRHQAAVCLRQRHGSIAVSGPAALRRAAFSALALAAAASAACSGNRHPATVPAALPVNGPVERGMASWYGAEFAGRPTASGERYDLHELTAAHPSLPFGTLVQVTNLANGRQVVVRINDRGPFAHRRVIDLSYAAARRIDLIGPGTAEVELAVVRLPGLPGTVDEDEGRPSALAVMASSGSLPSTAPPASAGLPVSPPPAATQGFTQQPAGAPASPEGWAASPARAGLGPVRYTVQVGAFSDPERAERLRADLLPLFPATAVRSDGTWSRVQVGAFDDREQADTLCLRLEKIDLPAIVVAIR